MKSCRCKEINPVNKEECLLPWGHENKEHVSGTSIWYSDEKILKEKETVGS